MKMLFHGRDFIDKVIVVAVEAGVIDQIEFIIQQPFDEGAIIWQYNPLGRHPALVLDDGVVLPHGILCCEYLDSLGTGPSLFPKDVRRWRAKSQLYLGDGLFDATSALVVQALRPPADRNRADMERHRIRILHVLPAMNKEIAHLDAGDFHIGHVGFVCGLNFYDMRQPLGRVALEEGDAVYDWRAAFPALASWYEKVIQRPSLQVRPSTLGIAQQPAPEWAKDFRPK
ncbi:MAG: hypothetical protein O3A21_00700 [Proteobacteria bacterium]|nr:hypothetical protein [Pseudomonadota bacterium]